MMDIIFMRLLNVYIKKSLCTHLTDISVKYKELNGYKIFY